MIILSFTIMTFNRQHQTKHMKSLGQAVTVKWAVKLQSGFMATWFRLQLAAKTAGHNNGQPVTEYLLDVPASVWQFINYLEVLALPD